MSDSLFDELDTPLEQVHAPTLDPGAALSLVPSSWREVPQVVFDSWSHARQLAYCAARDDDAALYADGEEEAEWYRERARGYREMLRSRTHG